MGIQSRTTALLFVLGAGNAAWATGWQDAPVTLCSSGCTHNTLSSAITALNGAAVKTLGIGEGLWDGSGKWTLPAGAVIIGAGAGVTTLSSSANDFIEVGSGRTISLSHLTVTSTSSNATCIRLKDSNTSLTLRFVRVEGCGKNSGGAALEITSGTTAVIEDSELAHNTTNHTGSSDGGGHIKVDGATLTIRRSVLRDGTAPNRGGAVFVRNSATVRIEDSQIHNNTVTNGVGGAIAQTNGNVTLVNTTLRENSATSMGGAIDVTNGTLITEGSAFIANTADVGGAVAQLAGFNHRYDNTDFSRNTATTQGGAIAYGTGASFAINGGSFTDNKARIGGAIDVTLGTLIATGTVFSGNEAVSDSTSGSEGTGGAIRWASSAMLTLNACAVTDGFASVSGGGISLGNGSLSLTDTDFANNTANSSFGGHLRINSTGSTTVNGGSFRGGSAPNGGAINKAGSGALTVTRATFDGGTATNSGGLLRINGGTANISFSDFHDGIAGAGGLIAVVSGPLTLTDSVLTAGQATSGDGGLLLLASNSTHTINRVGFSGGDSVGNGGAVALTNGYLNAMADIDVVDSVAGGDGGAIYLNGISTGSLPSLARGYFAQNQATNGGALYTTAAFGGWTWTDVALHDNTASGDGGGLFWRGNSVTSGPFTWTPGAASGNEAGGNGGALHLSTLPSATIRDVSFASNHARQGGGVFAQHLSGSTVLSRGQWCGNTADDNGGAVYFAPDPAEILGAVSPFALTLRNNVFDASSAGLEGGAVYFAGGSFVAEHNHFVGNRAGDATSPGFETLAGAGGALRVVGTINLTNNLFAFTEQGNAVSYTDNTAVAPVLPNNLWFSNAAADALSLTLPSSNLFLPPDLIDYLPGRGCGSHVYYPAAASPLLGGGTSGSDIGAFGGPDCVTLNLYTDADGDGFGGATTGDTCSPGANAVTVGGDCDDDDGDRNPAAPEVCDGVDNNCSGLVDDADPAVVLTDAPVFFRDDDLDGFGDDSAPIAACAQPPGFALVGGDCDDTDSAINPDAAEICDGIDNNCSGLIDDEDDALDLTSGTPYYRDADEDGFGDARVELASCEPTSGYVDDDTDCDDTDPDVGPPSTYFVDADGDGFGSTTTIFACLSDPNVADNSLDCNDNAPGIGGPRGWYPDCDGDSFGATNGQVIVSCNQPAATTCPFVASSTDCDDTDAAINPAAVEICDGGIDNNCTGLADDDDPTTSPQSQTTWYTDADGDGFGSVSSIGVSACVQPANRVDNKTDCNDNVAAINPNAIEVCDDGVDNNCNGSADDDDVTLDQTTATQWYVDLDGDGFPGAPLTSLGTLCARPAQSTSAAAPLDCDDTNASVYPGAVEQCDNTDNNCNGLIDDDAETRDWYQDLDNDGFGNINVVAADCRQPAGFALLGTDCDDTDATINPNAPEICDGVDNNCSGLIDEDDPAIIQSSLTYWYTDFDGDGFGAMSAVGLLSCSAPDGPTSWSTSNNDCNDFNSAVNPDADEVCDGFDTNCNGFTDDYAIDAIEYWFDSDRDGYGDSQNVGLFCATTVLFQFIIPGAPDCDDNDADVFPGAAEVCDGIDNNCSGLIDDADPMLDTSGITASYPDVDRDGWGAQTQPTYACVLPTGHVTNNLDCDDGDATLNLDDADGDGATTCDGDCDDEDPTLNLDDADEDGLTTCDGDCDDDDPWVKAPVGHVIGSPAECDPDEPTTTRPVVILPGADMLFAGSGCACDQRGPTGAPWLALGVLALLGRRRRANINE